MYYVVLWYGPSHTCSRSPSRASPARQDEANVSDTDSDSTSKDLAAENDALHKKIEQLQQQLKSSATEELRNQVKKLQSQLEDKTIETGALRAEVETLKEEHQDISSYANNLSADNAALSGEITKLQEQPKGNTDSLGAEVDILQKALDQAVRQRDLSKAQIDELKLKVSQLEAAGESKNQVKDSSSHDKQKQIDALTKQVNTLTMAVAVAESQRDQQMKHVKRLILEKSQLTKTLQETVNQIVVDPEDAPDPKTQPRLYALHSRMGQLVDRVTKVDLLLENAEANRNEQQERANKLTMEVNSLEKKLKEVKAMKAKPAAEGGRKKRLDFYSTYLQYALKPL